MTEVKMRDDFDFTWKPITEALYKQIKPGRGLETIGGGDAWADLCAVEGEGRGDGTENLTHDAVLQHGKEFFLSGPMTKEQFITVALRSVCPAATKAVREAVQAAFVWKYISDARLEHLTTELVEYAALTTGNVGRGFQCVSQGFRSCLVTNTFAETYTAIFTYGGQHFQCIQPLTVSEFLATTGMSLRVMRNAKPPEEVLWWPVSADRFDQIKNSVFADGLFDGGFLGGERGPARICTATELYDERGTYAAVVDRAGLYLEADQMLTVCEFQALAILGQYRGLSGGLLTIPKRHS